MKQGMVYLVGAGPGDYQLMTLKGQNCIRQADTIVYDRLADSRLLAEARPDAEMIYVGKASSDHTMRQEDINQLLVDKAKEGKRVLRLKGGDPFVFGRGGEEALKLRDNGIAFEIVPGVTSAIAVPAYAGIPVTHRGVAASFAVVTGHEDPTKAESTINWANLATATDTLVFLMGVENLPHISARLIENGRSKDTPAAVIRWGTKLEQRVLTTTVENAARDVVAAGIKPPAIFLVGDVVNLRDELAWFDTKPLFGKRILVTRAREQASALTSELEALGAQCIEAPAIKIMTPEDDYAALDAALEQITTYNWLVFTSPNGVERFFDRLWNKGLDSRSLAKAKIAAIGVSTAAKLQKHGLRADIIPLEFRAEAVVEALKPHLAGGEKVLLPRAAVARDVLPQELAALGVEVTVAPTYRTVQGKVDAALLRDGLSNGQIDMITFTSSSTVTNLLSLLGDEAAKLVAGAKVACIGPITAETCLKNEITPDLMAEEYTIDGLVKAILASVKE